MATGLLTMVDPVSPAPAVVLATAAEEEAAAVETTLWPADGAPCSSGMSWPPCSSRSESDSLLLPWLHAWAVVPLPDRDFPATVGPVLAGASAAVPGVALVVPAAPGTVASAALSALLPVAGLVVAAAPAEVVLPAPAVPALTAPDAEVPAAAVPVSSGPFATLPSSSVVRLLAVVLRGPAGVIAGFGAGGVGVEAWAVGPLMMMSSPEKLVGPFPAPSLT